jgi:hypothetical protein
LIVDHDRRTVVVIVPDRELARLLAAARHQRLSRGLSVPAALDELVDDIETALLIADVGNFTPRSDETRAPCEWVTVSQASAMSGKSPRTLRHRCGVGRYPSARSTSAGWLIHISDLDLKECT